MNEQQRLYLVQARSDWKIFHVLRDEPVCHRLHYLQMCMEKLAKSYFWAGPGAGSIGHAAFVRFLRSIASNRRVAHHLGFLHPSHFREWIHEISGLAYEFERLAPALAAHGPNPEYPWPRDLPTRASVEEDFPIWTRLRTRKGRNFYRLLEQSLARFEEFF